MFVRIFAGLILVGFFALGLAVAGIDVWHAGQNLFTQSTVSH